MIILDTCTFIWDALSHPKLTKKAKEQIFLAEQMEQLMICDITLWEVAMLVKKKLLTIATTAKKFSQLALLARNIKVLPITTEIAELSVSFDHAINPAIPANRLNH